MAQTFKLEGRDSEGRLKGAVCAIGVFDGVHLGHRMLIERASEDAASRNAPSAIVTFDIDPDEMLSNDSLMKLQGNSERIGMLASMPVDYVAVIPFSKEFAALTPEAFLEEFFGCELPAELVVGDDCRCGRGASGDVALLKRWGDERDVEVVALELLEADGHPVKSTRIRSLIREGRLDEANALLGRNGLDESQAPSVKA